MPCAQPRSKPHSQAEKEALVFSTHFRSNHSTFAVFVIILILFCFSTQVSPFTLSAIASNLCKHSILLFLLPAGSDRGESGFWIKCLGEQAHVCRLARAGCLLDTYFSYGLGPSLSSPLGELPPRVHLCLRCHTQCLAASASSPESHRHKIP